MTDVLLQSLLGLRRTPCLTVLIYHRVLQIPDPLRPSEPTGAEFESRMRWVKQNFDVISLADAVAALESRSLPSRALAITFDDGYRDNFEVAMPVLIRLGLPATFFIATGYLDGGRMFNDTVIESVRQASGDILDLTDLGLGSHAVATDEQRFAAACAIIGRTKYLRCEERTQTAEAIADRVGAKLPRDLMMTSEQVATMHRAGMDIGGHTVTHPILANIELAAAQREISEGRKRLEHIIGEPISLFAYPNGRPQQDYTAEHVGIVKALGFEGAVSTARGAARHGGDRFQIPRFTPWDRRQWKFGLRIMQTTLRDRFATV